MGALGFVSTMAGWFGAPVALLVLWAVFVSWRLLVTVPARVAPWSRLPVVGTCSKRRRRLPCFSFCCFPPRPPPIRLSSQRTGQAPAVPAVKLMVALGSGGHTGEMCRLLSFTHVGASGKDRRFCPIVFVSSRTDAVSERRVKNTETGQSKDVVFARLPRSREVGQSWLSTPFTTAKAFVSSVFLVARHQPDIILCNGPGMCFPLVVAAVVLNFVGLCATRTVFVESICRTRSLSLTGRLLYGLVDRFVVQWPGLAGVTGPTPPTDPPSRSEYLGLLM